MTRVSHGDKEAHIQRILDLLFSVNAELARTTEYGDDYAEKSRTLHKLKKEYRRLTGMYPILPQREFGKDSS